VEVLEELPTLLGIHVHTASHRLLADTSLVRTGTRCGISSINSSISSGSRRFSISSSSVSRGSGGYSRKHDWRDSMRHIEFELQPCILDTSNETR
jgi:hypothetical protein